MRKHKKTNSYLHLIQKNVLSLLICLLIPVTTLYSQDDLPVSVKFNGNNGLPLVVHITGDGGWSGFDVKMGNEYDSDSLSYIVLNSFSYFWRTKTPDEMSSDFIPVIRHYTRLWHKKKIMLVGFSFGAEVMPFLYNRLPPDLKSKVLLMVLLTPAASSDFTIHFTDMLGFHHDYDYNVVKETRKIMGLPILVVQGKKENPVFPDNKQANLKTVTIEGGHDFTDADTVNRLILDKLEEIEPSYSKFFQKNKN
jgi:type IV secretory pathway VirJ component